MKYAKKQGKGHRHLKVSVFCESDLCQIQQKLQGSMFKELKETMGKELKEGIKTVSSNREYQQR